MNTTTTAVATSIDPDALLDRVGTQLRAGEQTAAGLFLQHRGQLTGGEHSRQPRSFLLGEIACDFTAVVNASIDLRGGDTVRRRE